jgi:hypothetical protein
LHERKQRKLSLILLNVEAALCSPPIKIEPCFKLSAPLSKLSAELRLLLSELLLTEAQILLELVAPHVKVFSIQAQLGVLNLCLGLQTSGVKVDPATAKLILILDLLGSQVDFSVSNGAVKVDLLLELSGLILDPSNFKIQLTRSDAELLEPSRRFFLELVLTKLDLGDLTSFLKVEGPAGKRCFLLKGSSSVVDFCKVPGLLQV